jgi:flagellar hook-associated protein 3 FlgL
MRVTDAMMTAQTQKGLATARAAVLKAQQAATTGMRVSAPGDDATAAAGGRRLSHEAARMSATMATADEGERDLSAIDGALATMNDILSEARSLAVQGGNDTLSAGERASIADQIASLRSAMLNTAATKIDGRYVLNGVREDLAPYDAAGTFVGDRNLRQVEASPGHLVKAGIAIGEVLAPATGTDVIAAMSALETALRTGSPAGIAAGIDAMAAGTAQVADARGDVGNRMNTFQMAYGLGERLHARLIEDHAALVEADPYDVLSRLTQAQSALEQAVAIASQLPLPGLAQR